MGSYNFSYMLNCTNTIKTSESDQHKLTINQFCSIDNQENLIKDIIHIILGGNLL